MLTPEPKAVYPASGNGMNVAGFISVLTPEPKAVYQRAGREVARLARISVLTPEPKAVYPSCRAPIFLCRAISVLTPEPKAVYRPFLPSFLVPRQRFQCSPLSRRLCTRENALTKAVSELNFSAHP